MSSIYDVTPLTGSPSTGSVDYSQPTPSTNTTPANNNYAQSTPSSFEGSGSNKSGGSGGNGIFDMLKSMMTSLLGAIPLFGPMLTNLINSVGQNSTSGSSTS